MGWAVACVVVACLGRSGSSLAIPRSYPTILSCDPISRYYSAVDMVATTDRFNGRGGLLRWLGDFETFLIPLVVLALLTPALLLAINVRLICGGDSGGSGVGGISGGGGGWDV